MPFRLSMPRYSIFPLFIPFLSFEPLPQELVRQPAQGIAGCPRADQTHVRRAMILLTSESDLTTLDLMF